MALRYCSLGSGSSGNLYFVSDGETHIFIDLGIRCKHIKQFLETQGLTFADISGALITHSHRDHTLGLPTANNRFKLPTYMTSVCLEDTVRRTHAELDLSVVRRFESGAVFRLGTFEVQSFKVQHDTPDCHSFIVKSDRGGSLAVATDLGAVPQRLVEAMRECDVVVLESNYSRTLLPLSGYSPILQERIDSDHGHLSNDQCVEVLRSLIGSKTKRVHLAHISKESNTHDTALEYAKKAVSNRLEITALPRKGVSEMFEM